MLPIRFDDITPDDIVRLVKDQTSERRTIEYKQALTIGSPDDKAEFLADISSFANASGGDIIFGIADQRDANKQPTGIPEKIVPLILPNPATTCGTVENLIKDGIQPRIPVVQVKTFDIPGEGIVLVVRVGKSWIAPHMVSYANRTRFFSRNSSTGKVQLDVQQIGAAFAQQRGLGERIRLWKADRIGKAISGDGPIELDGPRLLFHFMSAEGLSEGSQSLPRIFDLSKAGEATHLMSVSVDSRRYNADGLLFYARRQEPDLGVSYLQIFRDGSLEYGDSYIFHNVEMKKIDGDELEEKIATTFSKALTLLNHLTVPDPIYVSLTLIGVRGMSMPTGFSGRKVAFDRDLIVGPDVQIEGTDEGFPYPSTLLPIVNSVWQAAGMEKTFYPQRWDCSS